MSFNRMPMFPATTQRQASDPRIGSPLHQSFPAYLVPTSAPGSAPDSPTRADLAQVRPSRTAERHIHHRNESRSSSVPSALYVPKQPHHAMSPHMHQNRRSVKHLTCFWWKDKGSCRFNEEDCLYAHHDTGHYTDPPRQVIPGEPAKAGRSLDRALKNLGYDSNMKTSENLSTPADSRPVTPAIGMKSSTVAVSPPSSNQLTRRLEDENTFLRNLTEHFNHEKNILLSTIELLQSDKKDLGATVENLTTEKEHLARERDVLRQVVGQLQTQRPSIDVFSPPSTRSINSTARLPSAGHGNNAYINAQQHAYGGINDEEIIDPKAIFRRQGPSF